MIKDEYVEVEAEPEEGEALDPAAENRLVGEGAVIGKMAPDFVLPDQQGVPVQFSRVYRQAPVLLAFYPGDFTLVCTKQLCNYRDKFDDFRKLDMQILGISTNPPDSHKKFAAKYQFPFRLVSDVNAVVATRFGCASVFLHGRTRRAVFIVNKAGVILYRYVEPTILSKRGADELVSIIQDLRKHGLI